MAQAANARARTRGAEVWAPLLALAALAWFALLRDDEASSAGLMGMTAGAYVVGWLLMLAAMMLPALAWFTVGYVRAIRRTTVGAERHVRTVLLALGYLAVWAATALVALAGAWAISQVPDDALPWVGGAVLVGAGLYQLSPLKRRCLARCRSPLSFALAAARHRGWSRDLRVGVEHGLWCAACCWPLMAVLVAVGTMSLVWMAILTAVVLLERAWSRGETLASAFGVALVVAGFVAPVVDWVAPGLHPSGMAPM